MACLNNIKATFVGMLLNANGEEKKAKILTNEHGGCYVVGVTKTINEDTR